ncbi:cardiolipin synthase [Nocardioides sp. BP30]|uniref:cardiolipin synthase n=1 Tax=Nocardioides sp. BP30 TaxID=3036374 RepID=UPI002469739E|nr:cardiolipin synthase [Nocardioides sp. BP30]WGL51941.1 cardiolipin synthase [Nocardioides sp. BP30]
MAALPSLHDLVGAIVVVGVFVLGLLTAVRAITRPNREPASRIAWVAVIMCLPVVGIVAYLFLGETSIGRERLERLRRAEERLAHPAGSPATVSDRVDASVADLCSSINDYPPVAGNRVVLLGDPDAPPASPGIDSNLAVDALVEAIGGAREHVHISFYIWLEDHNGVRVAEAVAAAARRGVVCRVMADAMGSRDFIGGRRWDELREAGVQLVSTLQDIPRLGHFALGRVDLRNHRKIVVIDNRVAFCGSQNCADPEFRVKPKFAPWVDVLLRCEGPVVRQAQHLFLTSWIAETGDGEGAEELYPLPGAGPAPETFEPGVVAQMFGTGPTTHGNAMSDAFVATLYAAQHELIITTPYLVPDEAMLRALCAAPRRGVETTLIVPARNDSPLVASASRSTYPDLLASGVRVHEYPLGLLHTKSITVDRRLALVGSANMDRRSLELNFENNLLLLDPALTEVIRQRQLGYLSQSIPVEAGAAERSFRRRLVDNVVGMLSPLL